MKNILKIAAVAAVAFTVTQSVQAIPVNGAIGFTGSVTYDTGSAATATAITSWINPKVNLDSGSFSTVPLNTAATFTSSVWQFLTGTAYANSPVNNFWAVGGFTFQLLSSSVLSHGGTPGVNGFVVVDGTGIVTGNGYDATTINWSFTSQDPEIVDANGISGWTFSASANSVPDGGATVMLLGIALSGVALLKKKLTA